MFDDQRHVEPDKTPRIVHYLRRLFRLRCGDRCNICFTKRMREKVWAALNDPSRDFRMLRNTVWGPTKGWKRRIEEGPWIEYDPDNIPMASV